MNTLTPDLSRRKREFFQQPARTTHFLIRLQGNTRRSGQTTALLQKRHALLLLHQGASTKLGSAL